MSRARSSKTKKDFLKLWSSPNSCRQSNKSECNTNSFDQKRLESDPIYRQILGLLEIMEILFDCDPENHYLSKYKKELAVLFAGLLGKYKISQKDFEKIVPKTSKLLNQQKIKEIQEEN